MSNLDQKYIEAYVKREMNLHDIAEATNRSPTFIWNQLHNAGVDTGRYHREINEQFKGRNKAIIELRRNGKKLVEIGNQLGITRARVGQIIKDLAPELIRGTKVEQ